MKYREIIAAALHGMSRQEHGAGMCVRCYPIAEWERDQNRSGKELVQLPLPADITLNDTSSAHDSERVDALLDAIRGVWTQAAPPADNDDGAAPPPISLRAGDSVYHLTKPPTVAAQGRAAVQARIALVTGGAQGLGRGIAEALVSHGALVYIADLNAAAADKSAAEICQRHRTPGVARALPMDCSDERSVRLGVEQVLHEVGGIDILICNAGIVIGGSIEQISAAEFEKVTAINYRGYFLLVKYCSPAMRYQGRANRLCYSDIIQINSKSGLVGSLRNSSYAGSKFGGIGLTQSFALELVDDNVKVNAICPGNLYDGALWSDPKRGLFVQYLRAGKVPGATSIADVRKAYEEKTPMKRGCEVRDIVKGVLYLIEQSFETGQALPISGGQIMLH